MKRIAIALLTGAALAAGISQGASAADMAVKAAPPPPAPTWTGVYVGVHAGAAWQSTPTWAFTDPNAPADLFFPVPLPLGGSPGLGGVGGLQAGYNWQFAPSWVAGVEADISWASLGDHRTQGLFLAGGGPAPAGNAVQMTANTNWLASARARLGYVGLWNNTLWYVTGGGAWVNTEYTGTATTLPAVGFAITNSTANTSFNTTKSGWVLGGGAEWQATTNILLRAEYLYYGFHNSTAASSAFFPPVAGAPLPVRFSWSGDYNVQVARIAASYKF